ncbi:MAG TPA: FHA domain-containing protein [Coleofasciculaceae cyanobacterium]
MNAITLEWREAGQIKTVTIRDQQPSKHSGTMRFGRDPVQCDVILSDPTVSGLHVEIFFNAHQQAFALRNLRLTNPPLVDGHPITQGEALLHPGSTIYLGQQALNVTTVSVAAMPNRGIAPTILIPPQTPVALRQSPPLASAYGLQCPRCSHISAYERIDLGCQWCGTSLAAAASVLMIPNGN